MKVKSIVKFILVLTTIVTPMMLATSFSPAIFQVPHVEKEIGCKKKCIQKRFNLHLKLSSLDFKTYFALKTRVLFIKLSKV